MARKLFWINKYVKGAVAGGGGGDTVNFTTTEISFTDPDIISPGRGAEDWITGYRVPNPTEADTTENSLDAYNRFQWAQIETSTSGVYTWTTFDSIVQTAINNGQKFSFGIMTHVDSGGTVSYDGASSSYPLYLHTLMQAETNKDWIGADGVWVPNWNSVNYLARYRALCAAVYTHIHATSYTATSGPHNGQSINFADVIYCVDLRGYGTWGEWHEGQYTDFTTYPSTGHPDDDTVASIATLIEIIDIHTEEFPDWPLVMMVAGYNGGSSSINIFNQDPEVAHHALTATNTWGQVGFRRDQWGATDGYLDLLMKNNAETYAGSPTFGSLITGKYAFAPVTGEPNPVSSDMLDLLEQVNDYHATSIGNGNYGANPDATERDRIRLAFKTCGYRLKVTNGSVVPDVATLTINHYWHNVGIAPTYENWQVDFELRSDATTVVWTGTSLFTPTLFPADVSPELKTDNFPDPGLTGSYNLYMVIRETIGYRQPLPLAITGRDSGGGYFLCTVVFS